MNENPMRDDAKRAMASAEAANSLFVSPFSAWEIATLVRKGRLMLGMAPESWFEALLALPGVRLAPMPTRTLIASAFLPGDAPNDPVDRIVLATARAENLTVVTRDAKMLSYADAGHVQGLRC
jgi:PIN domain nuclease of toxin-antitoxin system